MYDLAQFPTPNLPRQFDLRPYLKECRLPANGVARLDAGSRELVKSLDETERLICCGSQPAVAFALQRDSALLNDLRQASTAEEWKHLIAAARAHSLFALLHEDPFPRRAFEKPRGYPGDAVLIDFIYGSGNYAEAVEQASEIGRKLYLRSRISQACIAVRNRRDLLAETISKTVAQTTGSRIMSVAAGHLREAAQVAWSGVQDMELFLALDQDPDSLSEISSLKHHPNLVAQQATVGQILKGKMDEADFDLIYVAGLYDYLSDPVAVRLTEILFSKLRIGGRLLIANFMPTTPCIGWMEMFMDWFLIYRDEEQVAALAETLVDVDPLSSRIFLDETGHICFNEIIHV